MSLPNEDESPRSKAEREFQQAMLEALENARTVFGMPPFRPDDEDEAGERDEPGVFENREWLETPPPVFGSFRHAAPVRGR